MTKLNLAIPAAIAGLVFAGSAAAASLQPAAGEAPFFNDAVATSGVSRADVTAQAVAHMPAAGEMTAIADVPAQPSTLTRAQVRQETADAAAEQGGFPAASGVHS